MYGKLKYYLMIMSIIIIAIDCKIFIETRVNSTQFLVWDSESNLTFDDFLRGPPIIPIIEKKKGEYLRVAAQISSFIKLIELNDKTPKIYHNG